MGVSTGKRSFVSEINVVPFVDIILVLLIVFMVAAPMMEQGLEVDLPEARHVDFLPTDVEHLVLTIRQDGSLYLDAYAVPLEELETRLQVLVRDRGRALYLQADRSVPYGMVVDVMGRIRAAGIANLGIVALPLGSENVAGDQSQP